MHRKVAGEFLHDVIAINAIKIANVCCILLLCEHLFQSPL